MFIFHVIKNHGVTLLKGISLIAMFIVRLYVYNCILKFIYGFLTSFAVVLWISGVGINYGRYISLPNPIIPSVECPIKNAELRVTCKDTLLLLCISLCDTEHLYFIY